MSKVAFVTGATSGIGKAITLELASNGFEVLAVGRDEKRGEAVTKTAGKKSRFIKLDVLDVKDIAECFKNLRNNNIKLDVLVNCAGVEQELKEPLDTAGWQKMFDTNLFAAVECIRGAVSIMDKGVIVNIGSLVGGEKVVFPTYSLPYQASKAALHKVTESIAITYAPNIRAVTVSPGYVRTPLWDIFSKEDIEKATADVPLKRFLEPEEIAKAVLAIVENEAFNGTEVVVDAGLSLRKIF